MKYYSSFTNEYVQDICNALKDAGVVYKFTGKPFESQDFKTLTEFLQNHILDSSDMFYYLEQRGLVNRGRCPYTGQQIGRNSQSWTLFNRTVYLSPEGCKIMQREDDEDFEEMFGRPAPASISNKSSMSSNKGCSVLLAGIAILVGICFVLFT